ncbi:hypothetical protein BGW38_008918 [Lunasporangiospora selenospora]|uniref:PHD-type domain-containing protein n=1 Tax=Lunasporangiospora selenospora TaxID=979761 RepID=A0A9P6KG42_9FUNG|nr:hypothetical protein BGW38_008918 [Lunasporangiospora selenospora]
MDESYTEPDRGFDPEPSLEEDPSSMMKKTDEQNYVYLDQWRGRRVCAFCNDDGMANGQFIGPYPFMMTSTNRYGAEKRKHFWSHDSCARYSPEVIQAKDGSWYNVTTAMKRGRSVKCTSCKEKGATIGCFEPKCHRSFHVPCTGKPKSHYEDGVIFWCPQHEKSLLQRDLYDETFSCDHCSKILGVNPWKTCIKCSGDYFHSFDLCCDCFDREDINHEHEKKEFKTTYLPALELIRSEQLEKEAAIASQDAELVVAKKKTISYKPKMRALSRLVCSYCWSTTSANWRKGYNGVLMCEDCFLAVPATESSTQIIPSSDGPSEVGTIVEHPSGPLQLIPPEGRVNGVGRYATSAEDYSHSPYLTRTVVSAHRFDQSMSQAVYLDSYGPAENQLYSLPVDSTYYDIPGRAPRWATHSGTDYHGTWLPQTVRRAVTKYTSPNDKILSNFLGRGTDAIDCIAVDINPAAVSLSLRNCSFAIPPGATFKAEHRPTIMQGDSRKLAGPLFESESFDHYINEGFELEEFVVKRQRYCAMFGLGTYLCVQFDFLCFTHEFIATLRKVGKENNDLMTLEYDPARLSNVKISGTTRAIPSCPVERKSVVMGSVWTFKPTKDIEFPTLCASRMVERFGRNEANWEEYKLEFTMDEPGQPQIELWKENAVDILPPEEESMVTYERDRLQQIQENNKMLLELGLITELSESSDDIGHLNKISKDMPCYPPPAVTALRLITHIPCSGLKTHQISSYRTAVMQLAIDALEQLPLTGVLVVGTQDFRTEHGKLIPLSMLILEDIVRVVGEDYLRLKELIEAVPDGYQKDRRKITSWDELPKEETCLNDTVPTEHLPIVHACYLVFIKVKEKVSEKEEEKGNEKEKEQEKEKESKVEKEKEAENEDEKEKESDQV